MRKDSKIFVAGNRGLVGSSIVRKLKELGYNNILTRSKEELDLRDQRAVESFFVENKPDYVFLCAAKVGGIGWNAQCPAEFIYDNLQIQSNVIHYSYTNGVKKLLFLGSACIYPKVTPQPIKEHYLMSSELEPTNQSYALAKIAGMRMCQAYAKQYGFNAISVMPANLYGPYDNFNVEQCHVIPALISKFENAKNSNQDSVTCFGDGTPTREFLHVDDLADSCIYLMNNYDDPEHINIGSSSDVTIKELSNMIKDVVGYEGSIIWDINKPNGTPLRKLDTSRLDEMGWKSSINLKHGLKETYNWYIENKDNCRR